MEKSDILIIADSEQDADMLYATGIFVPDPFIFLRHSGRGTLWLGDLEMDRARRTMPRGRRVASLSRVLKALRKNGCHRPGLAEVTGALLEKYGIQDIMVPEAFPLGLAQRIKQLRPGLRIRPERIFPAREFKTPKEIKHIQSILRITERAMAGAVETLRESRVGQGGRLYHQGALLTSERLRAGIHHTVARHDGIAAGTIVAGGRHTCDPHERGQGALRAGRPIIIDIFPRSAKTGYFADITRTVVKGKASDSVRRMFVAVKEVQAEALASMRAGAAGSAIHQTAQAGFNRRGYKTGVIQGHQTGFFHGTGHGLGLEIHEAPKIGSNSADVLQAGHVVTVEPGLYYPGIGGVRLEDVVFISQNGPRLLTRFEQILEVD